MSEENTNVAPEAPSGGESLRDDVAKAFEQVESREAPPPADKATPTPARAPEGQPGERLRGPDGRYLAQDVPPKPAAARATARNPSGGSEASRGTAGGHRAAVAPADKLEAWHARALGQAPRRGPAGGGAPRGRGHARDAGGSALPGDARRASEHREPVRAELRLHRGRRARRDPGVAARRSHAAPRLGGREGAPGREHHQGLRCGHRHARRRARRADATE